MIDSKFTDEKTLLILSLIEVREDSEIQRLVTDNADILKINVVSDFRSRKFRLANGANISRLFLLAIHRIEFT